MNFCVTMGIAGIFVFVTFLIMDYLIGKKLFKKEASGHRGEHHNHCDCAGGCVRVNLDPHQNADLSVWCVW